MPVDIAEFDTIDECLLSMGTNEVIDAVVELYRDGLWDSLRANGDSEES